MALARIRVEEKKSPKLAPRIIPSHVAEGRYARKQGYQLDDIAYRLLRDPDAKASWKMGWQAEDADLKKKKTT